MRRFLIAASIAALATPLPALAGEKAPGPAAAEHRLPEEKAAAVAKAFSDPERQRDMALMLRAMTEVMLDMPVAPMVHAMEQATGEKGPDMPANATLRSMSPDAASRVPELIEKGVPVAMGAMGSAAKGVETMTPAMREMAARMAPMLRAMAAKMDETLKDER